MKIQVLFFAAIRDAINRRELELEFLDETSVADVLLDLGSRYPHAVPLLERIQVAVNEEYTQRETPLHDGDILALFPPVSGGSI